MGSDEETGTAVGFAGRYVILEHDHPFVHWDLMLESDGVLKTWRLLAEPDSSPIIAAEALADHRLFYLDYEGPVSGHRGSVSRWDRGRHQSTMGDRGLVLQLESDRRGTSSVTLSEDPPGRWTLRVS